MSLNDPLHDVTKLSPVGLVRLSATWETIDANAALLELLEVSSVDELRGIPSQQFIAPEYHALLEQERSKRYQGRTSSYECVMVGRRGTRRQVILSGMPILHGGELVETIVAAVDVLKVRQSEEALREALRRQQAVFSALGDGVLVVASTGDVLEANASAGRILGVSFETVTNIFCAFPSWHMRNERGEEIGIADLPPAVTLGTGQPCRNVVIQLERQDGTSLWLSINTEPLFQPGESLPRAVVVSFQDISELKESHRQVSLREARLAKLLDTVPDLLFVISHDGVHLDYRASRPERLFFPPESFLGKKLADVLPPAILDPIQHALQTAIATGSMQIAEYSSEPLGLRTYFEARLMPFDADTVLMVVRDITDARLAEQLVRQHEQERVHLGRLGALGAMVAGISHEINQPLHAIANFAAASLNVLDTGDAAGIEQARQWLEKIAGQAFRASEIVKRFRQFSSPAAHISNVPVSELLRESVELASAEFRRRGVRVEVHNSADDLLFASDRIQIQQVLLNFLVNAAEALERNPEKDRRIVLSACLSGDKLVCEVADNGIGGLPAVPQSQLFDSFYTTKPSGLGLGLAISRTIIESQGGRIWARPNSPQGAVFGFEIPRATAP